MSAPRRADARSGDALERLAALVRTPSVSGEEEAAAELVADWLVAAGVDVERVGRSLFAHVERGRGPTLMLASHLDTVPAGASWSVDPWDARWEDGRLMGLGANDAKASVVAMVEAARRFAAEPADAAGRLWLALTAEEETTNAGMAEVLSRTGRPDAAVVGEPTGLEVVRAQSGLAVLVARWRGASCHAAHVADVPHENALLAAARDLAGFPAALVLAGEHPLLGRSTLAATVLRAGERHNRVPDEAEALFDARLAPPHDAAECARLLAARLPAAEVRVRSERLRPVETAADHPLVRAACACAGRERAVGSRTMSDMALLAGVPAVKCGPGETARSHTPDEFVLAEEVLAGARVYAELVPAALGALAEVTT